MGKTERNAGQSEGEQKRDHAGHPPMYETPEELEKIIDDFFKKRTKEDRPPTQAGLAIALGFKDRQSLRDNESRSEAFSCVIKKALLYIEDFHESRLTKAQCTGSIVWLNSWAEYANKQETKHSGTVQIIDDIPRSKK